MSVNEEINEEINIIEDNEYYKDVFEIVNINGKPYLIINYGSINLKYELIKINSGENKSNNTNNNNINIIYKINLNNIVKISEIEDNFYKLKEQIYNQEKLKFKSLNDINKILNIFLNSNKFYSGTFIFDCIINGLDPYISSDLIDDFNDTFNKNLNYTEKYNKFYNIFLILFDLVYIMNEINITNNNYKINKKLLNFLIYYIENYSSLNNKFISLLLKNNYKNYEINDTKFYCIKKLNKNLTIIKDSINNGNNVIILKFLNIDLKKIINFINIINLKILIESTIIKKKYLNNKKKEYVLSNSVEILLIFFFNIKLNNPDYINLDNKIFNDKIVLEFNKIIFKNNIDIIVENYEDYNSNNIIKNIYIPKLTYEVLQNKSLKKIIGISDIDLFKTTHKLSQKNLCIPKLNYKVIDYKNQLILKYNVNQNIEFIKNIENNLAIYNNNNNNFTNNIIKHLINDNIYIFSFINNNNIFNYRLINKDFNLYDNKFNLLNYLKNCNDKRYIYLPIKIIYFNSSSGHTATIILDTKTKKIYSYEPSNHYKYFLNINIIYYTFYKYMLHNNIKLNYKLIDYISDKNTYLQDIEINNPEINNKPFYSDTQYDWMFGYCSLWSLYFVFTVLINENSGASIRDILSFFNYLSESKNKPYIKLMIRSFAYMFEQLMFNKKPTLLKIQKFDESEIQKAINIWDDKKSQQENINNILIVNTNIYNFIKNNLENKTKLLNIKSLLSYIYKNLWGFNERNLKTYLNILLFALNENETNSINGSTKKQLNIRTKKYTKQISNSLKKIKTKKNLDNKYSNINKFIKSNYKNKTEKMYNDMLEHHIKYVSKNLNIEEATLTLLDYKSKTPKVDYIEVFKKLIETKPQVILIILKNYNKFLQEKLNTFSNKIVKDTSKFRDYLTFGAKTVKVYGKFLFNSKGDLVLETLKDLELKDTFGERDDIFTNRFKKLVKVIENE
jgi:hypothetical protein